MSKGHSFNRLYQKAAREAADLEPWRGHFLVRKIETEILAEKFNFRKDAVGLELGCGCAFQSALLASLSNKIFATDLFKENGASHCAGVTKARDLVRGLDIENVDVISCSGTELPFAGDYFDFVFSSSVLEHIQDRQSALQEINRVLKPNGHLILIVPTHMASIYAFPHVFLYILARSLNLVFHPAEKKTNSEREGRPDSKQSLFARFRKNHPSFPLPEPHGAYTNIFKELNQQFPARWIELINKSGFKVIESFPTCLVPWLLIEPFSTKIAARLYNNTKKLHFGILSNLSSLAYLACFIATKRK